MPYTGNLIRLGQKPDALKLPAPSPRHGVREGAPELQRRQQSVPSGTGAEYQGTDFDQVVMSGHGMVLDTPASSAGTPPGSPDPDAPYRIDYTRGNPHTSTAILSWAGQEAMTRDPSIRGRAHNGERDRGWVRSIFWPEPMFLEQQPRSEINPDGPSSSTAQADGVGGAKYVRGINSHPTNNPSGWRNGRYRFSTWGNRVFSQIHRTIGTQLVQPRDVYTPGPQQRMIGSMITPPALPQDAPNPDDAITARTSYTSSPSSVIGGF